jgi:hypothetical protein
MLVDDVHDRTFDEFFWVQVADSIGFTQGFKRGAHNGWRAKGDIAHSMILNADDGSIGSNDEIARRDNGGQPGSLYDLWNTTAGESQSTGAAWLSNRSAAIPAGTELVGGKNALTGPTGPMLRQFYRRMMFLTGAITTTFFGKAPNRTDDDMAMLNDFAGTVGGTAQPRSVIVIGAGFADDLLTTPGLVGGLAFLNSYFGADLRNTAYRTFSGNPAAVAQYNPVPASALDVAAPAAAPNVAGMKFGLSDGCGLENDVLAVNPVVATAAAQVEMENVGANGPYVGAIFAPNGGGRVHTTFFDGSRIQRMGGIITYNPISGAPQLPISNAGLRAYMFKALTIVAGGLGCGPSATPVGVGDGPGSGPGSTFVNFMNLRSANPMRSGQARIAFGLARNEKVQVRVYDVTGRLVKTVADRMFVGGQEHVVIWDGTNDTGERVKSGVYFYMLKTPTWTSKRKLALLAN